VVKVLADAGKGKLKPPSKGHLMKENSLTKNPATKKLPKQKTQQYSFKATLDETLLLHLSRDELRALAKAHGIPRGKDRAETIRRIVGFALPCYVNLAIPRE
jgi:hypothetical protein